MVKAQRNIKIINIGDLMNFSVFDPLSRFIKVIIIASPIASPKESEPIYTNPKSKI